MCWLSRVTVLEQFHSLRYEIDLENIDLKPSRKRELVSKMYAHVQSFVVKLRLFERQISDAVCAPFSTLREIISRFTNANISVKMGKYLAVLTPLIWEFYQCFLVIEKEMFCSQTVPLLMWKEYRMVCS